MAQFRKIISLIALLCCLPAALWATHYRAGEITYRQLSGYTYEITVITYTDPANTAADRPEMDVNFGDGKSETVARSNGSGEIINTDINNTIKKNIYRTSHTFPGPYQYLINITDPNRVDGIKNINGGMSVNIPFYVESLLSIVEGIGNNQSPVLLLPPVDVGCINQTFTHNPAAYDPDGDSLAFTIVAPKRAMGQEVPNFTIPQYTDSFSIAINTGQLTWQKPVEAGHYNWAILIREFRGGKLIGFVVRDMQVYINNNCDNAPPVLNTFSDDCVEAGSNISKLIHATDPNTWQSISIAYYGSPFVQKNSPATMSPKTPSGPASGVSAVFSWTPSCNAIRYRPHMAVFRAYDNHNTKPLADISYWNIKVVGPAPKNVSIAQDSNGFKISWDKDSCHMAMGYKIYRRVDSSYWHHAKCETGVPKYTGYVLYDTTKGVNNSSYFDNNGGRGISPFIRYCYIISSMYLPRSEDGTIILVGENSESYASIEVCDMIMRNKPVITQVSVEKTEIANGKMRIAWIKPEVQDTLNSPAPYRYQLMRSKTIAGPFQNVGGPIDFPILSALTDTFLIDSLLNTTLGPYYYKVQFYHTKNGGFKLSEESAMAASVFAKPFNTNRTVILSWVADVPWQNEKTVIYRKNNSGTFDSIGVSTTNQYADTGLINGTNYCYRVKTIGKYNTLYYPYAIENFSQEVCGQPVDTIRPCVPTLSIDTPCNNFNNLEVKLKWIYPSFCDQDVVKYRIYWKKNQKEPWSILDSVPYGTNEYVDDRESLKFSIAGCYTVVAVDSFNNESYTFNAKCIDNCPYYQIPNVFTPNGDGKNDLLRPFPYRFIDKIDLVIYNRWGQEVFSTTDLNINWNGNDIKSSEPCTEGVYYYILNVYESYLEGTKKRSERGTINLIR